jgi:hypothetical protein
MPWAWAPGHAAGVDQLAPVPGGVIARISDTSTDVTYGALGLVVFIPAANAPGRRPATTPAVPGRPARKHRKAAQH